MKFLITCKLDPCVVVSHIKPITLIKSVKEIDIVRDFRGPKLPKVTYHNPPTFLSNISVIRVFAKLIILLYIGVKEKMDIVHAYYLIPHGINAFFIGKILRKPVIISLIGTDLNKHLKSRYSWILLRLLRYTNAITVTGNTSKKFLIEKGISGDNIYILPNAIDTRKFKPQNITKKYDVLYVGRLVPEKRIDVFLRIIARVKHKHKDIHAAIVGDGPLMNELKGLTSKLNIEENVTFLGFKENIEHYLNSSRTFVLTSETEGLPFAMIEAMACGIVPIVPKVGDIIDIAKDNVNSVVVDDYSNVDGFANTIIRLLEDKEFYENLSKNALLIGESYSIKKATEIYGEILSFLGYNVDENDKIQK